ncbi:hypothetical protein HGA34_04155 [Candidatus Falkowbacteria bacterium]|nr:hypothetical protein [Candidatus Falkowbacteria bacterium]
MQKPTTMGEAREQGLEGYEAIPGYLLILKHGLMGTFPALVSEGLELFICTDLEVLKKVWELLPKRQAKLLELNLLANLSEKIAFNAEIGDEGRAIRILAEEDFEALSRQPDAFMWSPGLLSLTGEGVVPSPFN